MNILHWMKKEKSGLAYTTLELANEEKIQGHGVQVRQPGENQPLFKHNFGDTDVHCIHSQLGVDAYHDNKPKIMWMHGEPLSSVGNGISMKAIVDLASRMDCFIAMRREEVPYWESIKKTFLVTKGIDLARFHPLDGVTERLSGEPAVLYYENWRGQRNPLPLCKAMEIVHRKLPNARLHLYNCSDKRMKDTFSSLIQNNKWWTFIRSLQGPVDDVNMLLNRADIVVSCLFPLYARGIEAFGAGKAFIGPGYREYDDYPWTCDLDPQSMADAIIKCHENYGQVNFRKWAEERHNVADTVKQSIAIYNRYL